MGALAVGLVGLYLGAVALGLLAYLVGYLWAAWQGLFGPDELKQMHEREREWR
jgi:hypothetical protein